MFELYHHKEQEVLITKLSKTLCEQYCSVRTFQRYGHGGEDGTLLCCDCPSATECDFCNVYVYNHFKKKKN